MVAMSTTAQTVGEISVARALELAAQLADIANGLRLDVAAQEARERELIGWLVRFLLIETHHHRDHGGEGVPARVLGILEQDDAVRVAFYDALAEADEAEMGGDDDSLPF